MKKNFRQNIKQFFAQFSAKNIREFVMTQTLVVAFIDWTKRKSFPGFFYVPIYDVAIFLWNEIKGYSLSIRANSIAYSFFIALFPSLLVLFTLVPYFSDLIFSFLPDSENYTTVMVEELNRIIPGIDIEITNEDALEDAVERNIFTETIEDILRTPRYGLLSLGFVLAMFFASNGMLAMMIGFEKSYDSTFKKRNGLKTRGIAIGLTFLLGFMLISSIVLIILGDMILAKVTTYLDWDWFVKSSFSTLRLIVFIALFYFGIALIYRYGASTHQRFRIFSPGATLATLLSIVSSAAFGYYIENFSQYNRLYGSIGTVIILLIWLQINAFIILAGFELNASIAVNRDLKERRQED